MLASFAMGIVGGQRAMTPLAAVAIAASRGRLPAASGALGLLGHPLAVAAALVLAAAEMAGDKQKSAPDRIVPVGLVARFATSALAGAALAPRRQRLGGAAVGGVTALAASFLGWRLRVASMAGSGQVPTGLVEDALVIAAATGIVRHLRS